MASTRVWFLPHPSVTWPTLCLGLRSTVGVSQPYPVGLGRAEREAEKHLLILTCLTLYRKGFQKNGGPMEMTSTQRCVLSFAWESDFSLLASPLLFWWHSLLPKWF